MAALNVKLSSNLNDFYYFTLCQAVGKKLSDKGRFTALLVDFFMLTVKVFKENQNRSTMLQYLLHMLQGYSFTNLS